jgi:uncharacterized protein DUF4149
MGAGVVESRSGKTTARTHLPIGLQAFSFTEFLLLGVWLGAMIFFSFAVAPSAFAVLPSRNLAGLVVGSTLTKVEWLGLGLGVVLLFFHFLKRSLYPMKRHWINLLLLAIMIAANGLLRFWISPEMNLLRQAMGQPVDDVDAADPLRLQFNDLHQYSVRLMGTAILCGLVLLYITVRWWLLAANRAAVRES